MWPSCRAASARHGEGGSLSRWPLHRSVACANLSRQPCKFLLALKVEMRADAETSATRLGAFRDAAQLIEGVEDDEVWAAFTAASGTGRSDGRSWLLHYAVAELRPGLAEPARGLAMMARHLGDRAALPRDSPPPLGLRRTPTMRQPHGRTHGTFARVGEHRPAGARHGTHTPTRSSP